MKALHPEILAPAGDEECMRAAVGAGANAVYFGLSTGFNARAKSKGFTPENLPRVFDYLHSHGVKGYITFNTVVYDSELGFAEENLTAIARAGADAVLIQDLGVARLCHALAPELPIHASTQMTVSSPESAAIAKELGVVRVVVPRELSIEEIRKFRAQTDLELEAFVHGALCVSYSGQCLTSEAWGQRSANRGQCAQSCRLPYDLVVDDRVKELGLEKYLLSPKDLGAYNLIPALWEAGIGCFKIEGRYKGADYVAASVEKYRKVLDAAMAGAPIKLSRDDEDDLAFTYSRGFSPGWLLGDDHQELSHGVHPGHRGRHVGVVESVQGFRVYVRPTADAPSLKPGDWMVFEQGRPEEDEPRGGIFSLGPVGKDGLWEIRFGDPGPDLTRVRPGNNLWKSHDSTVKRRMLRYIDADRKVNIDLVVSGSLGQPLTVVARDVFGRNASAQSETPLTAATSAPLDLALLKDKLGAFGDTRYQLGHLDVQLEGALFLSPAALKRVRRSLVDAIEAQPLPKQSHAVHAVDVDNLVPLATPQAGGSEPMLIPLCRTLPQVDAALTFGAREVYLDFMELVGLKQAVERVKAKGARVVIATMRIQKPGEEPLDKRFTHLKPDGMLARHLGALHHYRGKIDERFSLHGDFSLNCTNVLTGRTLLAMGLATLTPSYDLNLVQLKELARGLPGERLEVTLHQHLPLYHTEYCLYAHNLSDGKDFRDCGRPCEEHRVGLRDTRGVTHPVLVDVNCRNTVFNAKAQSAAAHLQEVLQMGVKRLRVEMVWETHDETLRVLNAYAALLKGETNARELITNLGALERYGVTSGTFAVNARKGLAVVQ